MPIRIPRFAPALGLAALALTSIGFAPHIFAQGEGVAEAQPAEIAPETVVATIAGEPITEADLAFAAEDLTQELGGMPPAERRAFLLRVLIDMKVMAQAAKAEGMDQAPLFQQRLAYLEDRALRRVYFAEVIAAAVTPEAVQTRYDELIAGYEPQPEIRASHILVETEEAANALRAEIEEGADFAALALEHSIDPGAANGGDLGFFGRGMMVAPFETAAFALGEVGEVSEPVQSQFGWHLIRLEDRRETSPPAIGQLGPQIQQQVLMDAFEAAVETLMEGVEIDIPDPELAAAVAAQQEAAAQ